MVQIKINQLRVDLLTTKSPTFDEELIVFQYNSQSVEGKYLYERYRGTSDYKDSEIFIRRVNNSINKDILRNKQGTIVIMLAAPDLTVGYNCIDTRRWLKSRGIRPSTD